QADGMNASVVFRPRAQNIRGVTAHSVSSPPPCGEGLGVGVIVGGHTSINNNYPPPHPSPTRGEGSRPSLSVDLIPIQQCMLQPCQLTEQMAALTLRGQSRQAVPARRGIEALAVAF